ncbi:MAG: hypothetical protein KDB03_03520 [Planctomycetales bacterium]|nr:hypothetical protein [Planctomycetales bacterium]
MSSNMALRLAVLCVIGFLFIVDNGQAAQPYVVVLGIAQDGGYPQAGCRRECCMPAWDAPSLQRWVTCLAIVDPDSSQYWLLDCTPDFKYQLHLLSQLVPQDPPLTLAGVFPTHAHIGHYTGLMHLGREVMGARQVRVYSMPRLTWFLSSQGPWSQLVELDQISLLRIQAGQAIQLSHQLTVEPFIVPHRDEFSETVGFRLTGPQAKLLYIPDIDKWERWNVPIEDLVAEVDFAFLDGTFYSNDELPGRNMSEIPHPFIAESLQRFIALPDQERRKIYFTHLNHSNPAISAQSVAAKQIHEAGMSVASQGQRIDL